MTAFAELLKTVAGSSVIKLLSLAFALGGVCDSVSAGVQITDLGFPGDESTAYSISDSDYVAGISWHGGIRRSFLCHGGRMTVFPMDGQQGGVNNLGQVVSGLLILQPTVGWYPALYSNGVTSVIGTLGGSYAGIYGDAYGINDAGQIVGSAYTPTGVVHAFLYDGTMHDLHDLPGLPGVRSSACAINNMGQIVLQSTTSNGYPRAFLYSNGQLQPLNPFGIESASARGINNHGDVVGAYETVSQGFRAYLYSQGNFIDIANGQSPWTIAYGTNDSRQVVGETWVRQLTSSRRQTTYETHAFIYQNGVLTDLNSLVPAGSDWTLQRASAINIKGHIVGFGLRNGKQRAFVLSW